MLPAEEVRRVLSYDPATGYFYRRSTGKRAGSTRGRYVKISVQRKLYLAHRMAWLYAHGEWPAGQIDHIDGNPHNNAIANLRHATASDNRANAPAMAHSKTKIRGVHFHRGSGRYRVQFMRGGRSYHGGYFDGLDEAARAARELAEKVHGEFACRDASRPTTRSVAGAVFRVPG